MARNMYGATSADFTITSGGRVIPGAVLTLWTARTGGTQITDLLDVDSVACTTVTSAADGSVVYYGPNNDKTVHWADSGQGARIAIRPTAAVGDFTMRSDVHNIVRQVIDTQYPAATWQEVATTGQFEGDPDPQWSFGWNAIRVYNTTLGNPDEWAFAQGMEADYNDGTNHKVEWYISVIPPEDDTAESYRPMYMFADRDTGMQRCTWQWNLGKTAGGSFVIVSGPAGDEGIASFAHTGIYFERTVYLGNANTAGILNVASNPGKKAEVNFLYQGNQKWSIYHYPGDPELQVRDVVNGANIMTFGPGTTVDTRTIILRGRLWFTTAQGTTVGAAGGASALPATPLGYFTVQKANGGDVKIPYYNA